LFCARERSNKTSAKVRQFLVRSQGNRENPAASK
jgi:hypothetical protein